MDHMPRHKGWDGPGETLDSGSLIEVRTALRDLTWKVPTSSPRNHVWIGASFWSIAIKF